MTFYSYFSHCIIIYFTIGYAILIAQHNGEHVNDHDIHPIEECATNGHSDVENHSFYNAIISSLIIGCAPIICIKCISTKDSYLKILLAFASGGLMGDVFLHLIPSALELYSNSNEIHSDHGHGHNDNHSILGMNILIGFGFFFFLEKLFHEFGHSHSHSSQDLCSETNLKSGKSGNSNITQDRNDGKSSRHSNNNAHERAVIVLNILADMAHNFTDGLTIAASFLVSPQMGISQCIAILLHEIPHEIGDYAILIENGLSKKYAMVVQFVTGFSCVFGTVAAFFVQEYSSIGTSWIIPFTAGGFLYIACVQILPVLVEKKYGMLQSIFHFSAFCLGVFLMVCVGSIEERIEYFVERNSSHQ